MSSIEITLDTQISKLRSHYRQGIKDGFIDITLSNDLTERDLLMLIEKHKGQSYSNYLYEAVVEHKNSTVFVHEVILNAVGTRIDNSLINSIITSGKTSIEILDKFRNNPSKSVQEHLELAYLNIRLKSKLSIEEYKEMLDMYSNDDINSNQDKRYLIASAKNTPKEILDILSNDHYDHISKMAKINVKQG
ncbi:MAG: hypothetical protein LBG92_11315 [Prevotellaceae bacterium]|nr:hypothetical protein [Prevotellaceae bacterium]